MTAVANAQYGCNPQPSSEDTADEQMARQPLILPDIAVVEDCRLINKYLRRVSEAATDVSPIPAINPPDDEVIEVDSDAQ